MFLYSPQDELYIVKFDKYCDSKYSNTYLIDKKFRTFDKKNNLRQIITQTLVHNAEYSGGSAGCCKCCSGIYKKKA